MNICGVDFSGKDVMLVLLRAVDDQVEYKEHKIKKISIIDHYKSEELKNFKDSLSLFVSENNISNIAIRKRAERGKFAGGVITFKLEGIVQLLRNVEISFYSPTKISSILKKNKIEYPKELNKYLYRAYEVAFVEWITKK